MRCHRRRSDAVADEVVACEQQLFAARIVVIRDGALNRLQPVGVEDGPRNLPSSFSGNTSHPAPVVVGCLQFLADTQRKQIDQSTDDVEQGRFHGCVTPSSGLVSLNTRTIQHPTLRRTSPEKSQKQGILA